MFGNRARGWHLWGPFLVLFGSYGYFRNLPSVTWEVAPTFYTICAIVAMWGMRINLEIMAGLRNERAETEQIPEPKPEIPVIQADGFKPIIRVGGQVHYAFKTEKVAFSKEREMYVILWRWYESGKAIDLREEYWVKHKKFFTRKEFANDIMVRADRNSITCRLGPQRNASRDILDWNKVEKIARGGALPH